MNPTKSSNYEIETLKGSFILKKRWKSGRSSSCIKKMKF